MVKKNPLSFAKYRFRLKRERTLTRWRLVNSEHMRATLFYYGPRFFFIYVILFLIISFYIAFYERIAQKGGKGVRAVCRRVNEPLNIADDRLYVMHQLYVIANNYLIPVACSHSCPFNPDTPLLSSYASYWDSHCPLVNHDAISRHRGPRLCAQPARDRRTQLDAYASREYTVEIYVLNGKEDSQYFKVKLSDLDSVGGQDDRSSFPTVTAKSCFGIPPNDVFVVRTR